MLAASEFNYGEAFSRNIGWVSHAEQSRLRNSTVSIAGMGGVGGFHLLTLARLGVGRFRISDLDVFELANFNRQAGATISNLDKPKIEVLQKLVRDINPEAEIELFPAGIDDDNAREFLSGVDIYIDGLDFFAFHARETVFRQCASLGVPAVTAAPLGMSAGLVNFLPGAMTFEQYFRLTGYTELEKSVRFLVGLAPKAIHRAYLADRAAVDLKTRRGPSTAMACMLCAGVAGSEGLKILLGRKGVQTAPHSFQFDAYRNRLSHAWRPGGNRNPLNIMTIALVKKILAIDSG